MTHTMSAVPQISRLSTR